MLQRLHEIEPGNPEAWFDRALMHQNAGRHADALADYDRAIFWGPPLVEALHKFHHYFGEDFKVECPTHAPAESDLWQVAAEISRRLTHIFLRGPDGRRPVAGGLELFQSDPHWRDLILFHEYFHGDNGAGIGASHQTGWTGLVAKLIEQSGE